MRTSNGRKFRAGLVMLAALVGVSIAGEAAAYCRSTTCDARTSTCPLDGNGCPKKGAPLSWRALPLVYRFHAPGSEKLDMDRAKEAVRRAFETWSNVTCKGKRTSLRFEEGPEIPGKGPLAGDNPAKVPFGVYFRDEVWPYDDGEESLALTNQTFGMTNGYIDYSDIEVNTSARAFALADDEKGIDLQAAITHEVGHYIGLAHSPVATSIMVASYCQSGERCGTSIDQARALDEDDTSAVCALYPPSGIAGVAYEDPAAGGCAMSAS
ncbi:MAG TPA: matrixin family metalloprotease, partial [Labilithrix sp.]|nr:matrixin family metalloprotease [Labilithrix sp.]